ncbi:MAG TPA: hypothetical protein DEF36_12575 [Desulfotomaculum sp.]|nr:hypothetical protein [Desulfotomaculum sp.]
MPFFRVHLNIIQGEGGNCFIIEKTNLLSKNINQFIKFVKEPKEPVAIIGVAFYTIFLLSLISAAYAGNMKWGVYSGSQLISVVSDPAEARDIISQLIEEHPRGEAAALLGRIQVKKTSQAGPVVKGDALRVALNDTVASQVRGAQILVDGKAVLAMRGRAEAENLLSALKAQYEAGEGSASFVENVEIAETMIEKISVMSVETALDAVKGGTQKIALYEIKDGDTLWDIATASGLSVEQIVALNPGMNPDRLQLGESISLSRPNPMISVKTVTAKTATEIISPPVEEKKDSSLYLGEKKILAGGKSGKKEVTYEVTSINGMESDRQVLEENIVEKAEPKVVATGTRVLLASRGSSGGRLSWPTVGSVISPFGRRGGRLHAGVDINARSGVAVSAAQAGTVIRAGWYSGYGKCVDISHGDGIVTRYGHLSSIAVSSGQKVGRGQFIGRVGATGNTTGPHLHLEVRVNGQARNPMSFF